MYWFLHTVPHYVCMACRYFAVRLTITDWHGGTLYSIDQYASKTVLYMFSILNV